MPAPPRSCPPCWSSRPSTGGELRLDQQVTATATALRGLPEDGSTADIVEGETLTVEQLLYCMLVISANETCNILGETLCGSVDAFVGRMNQRAQELGCKTPTLPTPPA